MAADARLRSPEGTEHDIVAAGVDALLALGWQRVDKHDDKVEQGETRKRAARSTKH